MKTKTKLIASIMSICLVCAVFAIGVFALKTANLKIGGDVSFQATGVEATISGATLTGMATPEGFQTGAKIDTSMTQTDIDGKFSKWTGLTMAFDSSATDIVLSFYIKNDSTNANNYIEIDYDYTFNKANPNVDVFPAATNNYLLEPNAATGKLFKLIVRVLNKELNVSDVTLDLTMYLKHTPVQALTESANKFEDQMNGGQLTMYTANGVNYLLGTPTANTATFCGTASGTKANIAPVVSHGGSLYTTTSVASFSTVASAGTSVVLPNTITTMGVAAFYTSNFTSIKLSKAITELGNSAFRGASGLTTLTLPNSITTIESGCFASTSLTTLILPNSLTTIAVGIFEGNECANDILIPASVTSIAGGLGIASNIVVDEGNKTYHSETGCIIETATNKLISAYGENVTIPSYVKILGRGVFTYRGVSVNVLTIPEGVTTIESNFLGGNTGVSDINLPSTITEIGDSSLHNTYVNTKNVADMLTYDMFWNSVSKIYIKIGIEFANTQNFHLVETSGDANGDGYIEYSLSSY